MNRVGQAQLLLHSRPARAARGISLVELLVAIAIGLVIVAATTSMLVTANRSNAELARSGQINESGRFALQIMANEVSRAGFWGGWIPAFDELTTTGVPTDYPTAVSTGTPADTPAIPDPCKTYTDWSNQYRTNLVGIPVQVYEVPASAVSPVCASLLSSPLANTDILIVRGVEPCQAGPAGCTPHSPAEVFFQRSLCGTERVYVMTHLTASLTQNKRDCAAGTAPTAGQTTVLDPPSYRFVSTVFYVRSFSVTAGDGIPTLMMSQFGLSGASYQHNTAQPLIPGVQGFRVELGVDNLSKSGGAVNQQAALSWADSTNLTTPTNRGDGVPDTWVRCTSTAACSLAQLTNVVAVRLNLLVRAETATNGYTDTKIYSLGAASAVGPFNDSVRRRVYTQTVSVQNVALRRETPN